jgi:hypothetical protein
MKSSLCILIPFLPLLCQLPTLEQLNSNSSCVRSLEWPPQKAHPQLLHVDFTAANSSVLSPFSLSPSRFLARDFNMGTITVSLNHSKYLCTTAHTKFSLHIWTFSQTLDSSIICQLRTPELSSILILVA